MFGQHRKRRKERNRAEAQLAHEQGVEVGDIKKQRKEKGQTREEFLGQAIAAGKGRRGFEKLRKERETFANEKKLHDTQKPEIDKEAEAAKNAEILESTKNAKQLREEARQEGRKSSKEFFEGPLPEGLDPEKRKALQYEANKGIQRSHQSAERKLLGDQGQRGISGKSGVGFAQQKDLYKMANEAKGGVQRDLTKLDADLAMKKLAAMYAGGEGEASQAQLDRQIAADEINLRQDKKRQKEFEDQIYKLFNRV
jgi:hypothetical protein